MVAPDNRSHTLTPGYPTLQADLAVFGRTWTPDSYVGYSVHHSLEMLILYLVSLGDSHVGTRFYSLPCSMGVATTKTERSVHFSTHLLGERGSPSSSTMGYSTDIGVISNESTDSRMQS